MPVSESKPIQGATTAIAALQPQIKEDVLQRKTGWQGLTAQAARINQLATELEDAIFEFKLIANDVNLERRIIQANKKQIISGCEYLTVSVPCDKRKKGGAFSANDKKS